MGTRRHTTRQWDAEELQRRFHQKGTEEIAEEDVSIFPRFSAAISSVPLRDATLQFSCNGMQPP